MTLFAGICALSPDTRNVDALSTAKHEFLQAFSRGCDAPQVNESPTLFLVSVDVGAFGESGVRETDQVTTAVAGEPLFRATESHPPSRISDLAQLASDLSNDASTALKACRGTFAICHHDKNAETLLLAVDRVGVRPLYYYVGANHLYFSTSLRALEEQSTVQKRLDLRGLTEETVLGYALGDRTPYADIRSLQSGEFLYVSAGKVAKSTYFRFEDVEPTPLCLEEFLDASYICFRNAVAVRAAQKTLHVAF